MRVIVLIQARISSHRLPGKVLKKVNGKTLISILTERLKNLSCVDDIILAVPDGNADDALSRHCLGLGLSVYRGSENNVLERFYQAATIYKADAIVRITGDCPLIDPAVVKKAISIFKNGGFDYVSNVDPPSFPDGMDVEIFSYLALENTRKNAHTAFDKEHVTTFMRASQKIRKYNFCWKENLSAIRLTVDDEKDLKVIEAVCNYFHPRINFCLEEIVEFIQTVGKTVITINKNTKRNEGLNMDSGQKLWQRAKKIIPAGNMLLSKRPEMFLPNYWPVYFSRTNGCRVWDLDNKSYYDLCLMGVGTNLLGYNHPEVNEAVKKVVDDGNLSTLNAPEEVFLAERLIDLHPFAEMAKFCRTGGEANAVAVRIARAASGRETIAICGYHGWQDWYLAANLGDKDNLDGHLLPGLEPNGVSRSLLGTVVPFRYNRIDQLEVIIKENNLAAIKMEVCRDTKPDKEFLMKVRSLATKNNIVLIFDECTSGFRETFGGLHKKYGIEPDMAVFGKALGNGYAITSVIGSRSIMEAGNSSFISSTFWTERIGSVAALKTLEVMEREKSWETVTEIGRKIKNRWKCIAESNSIDIKITGLNALCTFAICSKDALKYKTLITQEMLSKGYLAGTSIYVSTAHTDEILDCYYEILDDVFRVIYECENGRDIDVLLNGPVCHTGFKRLN